MTKGLVAVGRNIRDGKAFGYRDSGKGVATDDLTDNGFNFVFFDQATHGVSSFNLITPGIHQHKFNFLPQNFRFKTMSNFNTFPGNLAHGRS